MNWDDLSPTPPQAEAPKWDDLKTEPPAPSYTDLAKSKAVEGLGNIGDMREWAISNLPQGLQDYARASLNNPITRFVSKAPTSEHLRGATGVQEVQPQGTAQEAFGGAVSALTNPVSIAGPGGLALKAGSAALGGAAGAVGAREGENIAGTPGRVVGGLAGGLAGGMLGGGVLREKAPTAAIPTADELKASKKALYAAADKTGYEVTADAVKNALGDIGQKLLNAGHAPDGSTLKFISELQRAPATLATAPNLGAIQKRFSKISQEVELKRNGLPGPTDNAEAARKALADFRSFLENPPQGVVLGGNAKDYMDALGLANREAAAEGKLRGVDARISKAERAADRSGTLDSRIRQKVGAALDNPNVARTFTKEEEAQANRVNSGTTFGLDSLGRAGGHGVIPLLAHATAGVSSGGASLPYSAAILAGGLLGRYGADAITRNRAQSLSDMIAKNSNLYQQRLNQMPPAQPGMSPLQAQLLRSAVTGLQNGR